MSWPERSLFQMYCRPVLFEILHALWTGYYNRARRKWHAGFQTQAQIYMSVFDDLMDAVDPDDVGKLTEHLRPIRETVERRGALSDNMYRAVIDEDGVAHMLVNPDELDLGAASKLRAKLLDGIRVLGDIVFYVKQQDRVKNFKESTKEIDDQERALLIQLLEGKILSPTE